MEAVVEQVPSIRRRVVLDHIPEPEITTLADKNGNASTKAQGQLTSTQRLAASLMMRFSWALVHSRRPEDVQRRIAMLEASLSGTGKSPQQMREELYLLAVGYFRRGDYPRSRQLVERYLEIQSDWRQALNMKKAVEDRITNDGAIGIGIVATVAALLTSGLAA